MNTSDGLNKVKGDLVVGLVYELRIDGELIDSCEQDDPLLYIQGHGHIVPGLEREVEGMAIGESKNVLVKAEDGYGEYEEDAFIEVPRSEFPEDVPLELDMELAVEDDEGNEISAFIEEITLDKITLNFNHPLAGDDLDFTVKVVSLRYATEEELEHDHVHLDDHDHS